MDIDEIKKQVLKEGKVVFSGIEFYKEELF